jgi:DNA-binding transcriptional LysR family regulator
MFDLNGIAMLSRYPARAVSLRALGKWMSLPKRWAGASSVWSRNLVRGCYNEHRTVTLASAGEAFKQCCAAAVDGLINAAQEVVSGNSEPKGHIRVASAADFFIVFPMAWKAEFLSLHLQLRLAFVLSDAKADLIAERLDVAFRGGPSHDTSFVGGQLLRARTDSLVASRAYLAGHRAPSALQDLRHHDCITSHQSFGRNGWRLTVRPTGWRR